MYCPRHLCSILPAVVLVVLLAACSSSISDPSLRDVAGSDLDPGAGDAPQIPDLSEPGQDTLPPKDIPVLPDAPPSDDVVPVEDIDHEDVHPPPECESDYDCDDGEDCTSDYCDEAGVCRHVPKEGFCHIDGACYEAGDVDPENPCRACLPLVADDDWTADDTLECAPDDLCATWLCRDGACVARPILFCEDPNPCTASYCDGDQGCVFEPLDGVPCDDGDPCTVGDLCVEGVCTAGTGQLSCDDGNQCTLDRCEPGRGCVHTPNDGPCDDGDVCTVDDQCLDGVCVGTSIAHTCDDGDPCTDFWCDPVHGCLYRDNTAPCDDGDPCTVGDRCVGRVCVGGADAFVCDDGNPCTDGLCVPFEGCAFTPNTGPCDDGDACTTSSVCDDGECVATEFLDCDDGNLCTENGCDPVTGCWAVPLDGGACDDGLVCTVDDTCVAGECRGTPLDCADGNDCTANPCVEPIGCVTNLIDAPECGFGLFVETPARGETLDPAALEDGLIPVRGYVDSPADPDPVVTLNGQPLALAPIRPSALTPEWPNPDVPHRFTFDTAVAPEHAMNLLRLNATDAFEREVGRVQSFYFSTVYYPMTENDFAATRVPAGVAIGLSQEFMDDDDPELDDLAALVDLILQGLDIKEFIPTPAAQIDELGCRYDINITSATFNGTRTDIQITDDGLGIALALLNLDIRFRLSRQSGSGFWCPGSQDGRATATEARVTTRVRITVVDGAVNAALDESATDAQLINLNVTVDGWFTNFILSFFQGTIRSLLEEQLEAVIRDQVEPLLGAVFDALLLELDIEIPAFLPGADPAVVSLRTAISNIVFTPDEFMHVEMDAATFSTKGVPYDRLGSLGYANCLTAPFDRNLVDFRPFERINIGLFDDVANQLLHAAWHTGAFEIPLGPDIIPVDDLVAFGVSDLQANVSMLLPPVLTSCKDSPRAGDLPDAIMLELGDLEVSASLKLNGVPVDLLLYASLRGAARLDVVETPGGGTEIGIWILGFDEVDTDVVEVISPDPTMGALVGTLIEQALMPILLDQFAMEEPIGFELPVIDLSNPEAGIPEGTALIIAPTEVSRTDNANTLVKGTINAAQ